MFVGGSERLMLEGDGEILSKGMMPLSVEFASSCASDDISLQHFANGQRQTYSARRGHKLSPLSYLSLSTLFSNFSQSGPRLLEQ